MRRSSNDATVANGNASDEPAAADAQAALARPRGQQQKNKNKQGWKQWGGDKGGKKENSFYHAATVVEGPRGRHEPSGVMILTRVQSCQRHTEEEEEEENIKKI